MFLEISQKSQENTCARASILIKLGCNFIKIETLAQVFSHEFCEIAKNTFFAEQVWATASKYKEIFYAFGLKNKIVAGIKFQVFAINRTWNYYIETVPYITLTIQMFK